ncbi:MAG TPA: right-handed parallel beta-helix repeat-containing protein [Devosiaceae bacterium]|nr:right-handed parallel beta-helix repeat-containing protein [Devosiaceae bacterium]
MPHTFYIDSTSGNDANAGTSADAAFKSLAALNRITLQPGDSVLLARGSSYSDQLTLKDSGTAGNPITIGAYGEGAAPVIKGAATGIYGDGTHDVVVHDIAIADTSGYAVLGSSVSNWTLDGVTVLDTGSASHSGAVSFESSSDITVKDTTISGVTGDGMLINGGHDITIAGNRVGTVQGIDGDNVQVNDATDVTVTGNQLDMTGKTDSTKGNLVVNHSDNVDIEHNTMAGGKYGASVNSDHVTIASNDIHGQGGYDWSFGIGLGENWNVSDYDIRDNTIHDVAYGVALTGDTANVQRNAIDIQDNTFDQMGEAALKVDRAASGEFTGNHIGSDSDASQIPSWITEQGKFLVSGNDTFPIAPAAVNDVGTVHSNGVAEGNILANDQHDPAETLFVRSVDGSKVGAAPVEVAGTFGTLSIAADGTFHYAVDESRVEGHTGTLHDSFMYKMSDGSAQDSANLDFAIDPHALQATSDFHF